jgi:hypothetical protein
MRITRKHILLGLVVAFGFCLQSFGASQWERECRFALYEHGRDYSIATRHADFVAQKLCLSNYSHCQLRLEHGPTLDELAARGEKFSPQDYEDVVYLRGPSDLEETRRRNPRFLPNTKAAHADFENWFSQWLAGKSMTFSLWQNALRERHKIATGFNTQTAHLGPLDTYRADSGDIVLPGFFRNEGEDDESCYGRGNTQQSAKALEHVDLWLVAHDFEAWNQLSPRFVEVNGLDILGTDRARSPTSSYAYQQIPMIFYYPDDLDIDLFLQLGWDRLKEVKRGIMAYKRWARPATRTGTLHAIADYYHTAIIGHYFRKVNNSMLMPEVNTFLRHLGLKPIQHGTLDLVAIRMDYIPFRRYFIEYLQAYSSLPN